MDRAALDYHITSLERLLHAVIQIERELAMHDDRIVKRKRTMEELSVKIIMSLQPGLFKK